MKKRQKRRRSAAFAAREGSRRSEQLGERLDVEEAHMKELQEFNAAWDAKAPIWASSGSLTQIAWNVFPLPP